MIYLSKLFRWILMTQRETGLISTRLQKMVQCSVKPFTGCRAVFSFGKSNVATVALDLFLHRKATSQCVLAIKPMTALSWSMCHGPSSMQIKSSKLAVLGLFWLRPEKNDFEVTTFFFPPVAFSFHFSKMGFFCMARKLRFCVSPLFRGSIKPCQTLSYQNPSRILKTETKPVMSF